MASLRQIRTKIKSVRGTRRIMSAMKLISAVKLRRAQELLLSFRPYSDAYLEITKSLARRCDPEWHPLLRRPEALKRLHLVFMTSDRGLCGSFNSNLIRKLETYLVTDAEKYEEVKFTFLGRRGRDHFARNKIAGVQNHIGINEKNYSEVAESVASALVTEYIKEETDEIILVYNYFRSALTQVMVYERILPIEPQPEADEESTPIDYLYEPTRKAVLKKLLTNYVKVRVERAIEESLTSEHASRMTAMENATGNADDVIKKLTLLANKTRQSMITTELMDIVNGTEALRKGGAD
jgi:F-type H+-transporting ATPase subunit gamma